MSKTAEMKEQDRKPTNGKEKSDVPVPKRTFTVEFLVGIFALLGVAAFGYQAIGLAGLSIVPDDKYEVLAEFDNVSGLKSGAPVEIAGVPIGEVAGIRLKDPQAIVVLHILKSLKLFDDDIASIRTKGIIGDRYVKISRGASETAIPPGGTLFETESVVDIEDIIGKIVHNFGGDDDSDDGDEDF